MVPPCAANLSFNRISKLRRSLWKTLVWGVMPKHVNCMPILSIADLKHYLIASWSDLLQHVTNKASAVDGCTPVWWQHFEHLLSYYEQPFYILPLMLSDVTIGLVMHRLHIWVWHCAQCTLCHKNCCQFLQSTVCVYKMRCGGLCTWSILNSLGMFLSAKNWQNWMTSE